MAPTGCKDGEFRPEGHQGASRGCVCWLGSSHPEPGDPLSGPGCRSHRALWESFCGRRDTQALGFWNPSPTERITGLPTRWSHHRERGRGLLAKEAGP